MQWRKLTFGAMKSQFSNCTTACIVVNWRAAEETLACLERLFESDSNPGQVVVVENGSPEHSAEELIKGFVQRGWSYSESTVEKPLSGSISKLHLLRSPINGGFAWANNRAVELLERSSSFQAYWLLNNDTRVEPGALPALLDALVEEQLDIVGSRSVAFDDPSRTLSAGGWISRWSGATHRRPAGAQRPPDYAEGASFLFTAKLFKELGPLSEDYFLYYEETDYCFAAKSRGYRVGVAETSSVRHRVGATTGSGMARGKVPFFADALQLTNRVRFAKRHLPSPLLVDIGWLLSLLLRISRGQFQRIIPLVRMRFSPSYFAKVISDHGGHYPPALPTEEGALE